MDGNERDALVSELQSKDVVTAADIERVTGWQSTSTGVVCAFADLCRRSERTSWKLKALHLFKDDDKTGVPGFKGRSSSEVNALRLAPNKWRTYESTDGGGFEHLVRLFEEGYLNDICDLRFVLDKITRQSMGRFCKLFQSGRLSGLRILHFCLRFRFHKSKYFCFWEELANLLSSAHLSELAITNEDGDRQVKDDLAARVLANQFASGHLVSLRVLNLQSIYIGDKGMGCLSEAFCSGHATELECLELGNNYLGKEGAGSLSEALVSGLLRSLRVLHLSSNKLGDEGVVSLATSFHGDHISNLESLRLTSAYFGEVGARALAEALASGHLGSLRILDLSSNGLGDKGVLALADTFQTAASKLEALKLNYNNIGDEGTRPLRATFERGKIPRLISLNLGRNNIGSEGLAALVKAFKSGHLSDLRAVDFDLWPRWEKLAVGIVDIAGDLEAGSLPHLKEMILLQTSFDFINSPLVVKDALENSYRRNPYLIARLWNEDNTSGDPWLDRLNNLRRSNQERVDRLKELQDEEDVVGQHGKVFFCGDPRVGKTTLKITLSAREAKGRGKAKWRTMFMDKTCGLLPQHSSPQGPEPTRGIEVTNIESEGVTLALWDLAGQHDYEVLHSAFMPDLNFAGGQATFFVIVCMAHRFDEGKKQLEYWMRFISSNSMKDAKADRRRFVYVVLNRFHGNPVARDNILKWKNVLTECEKGFGMYLSLFKKLFIMDARSGAEVQSFKATILEEAKKMLQSRKMPQICLYLQEQGRKWVEGHKNIQFYYPVLTWHQYGVNFGAFVEETKLSAAAEYLHEAGHIILFRNTTPSSASEGQVPTSQGRVIVDPEWFCKQVVGNLLLPEDIESRAENRLEILQEEEGALVLISALSKEEFKLQVPQDKIDETVMILSRLGICYQIEGRAEHIFVPALIKKEEMPGWSAGSCNWERGSGTRGWVMGFSLRVKNLRATLLPINVLRKMQVNLALDKSIGGREDRSYLARKFSISFKFNSVEVFIEYSSSKQDRIDVLVRPSVENISRAQQIEVAQGFVNRIKETVNSCAVGVELDRRIIKPWGVSEGWKRIEQRDIGTTVASVISRLEESGKLHHMEWEVGPEKVAEEDILSNEDLFKFFQTISKKLELTKEALNCLSDSSIEEHGKREGTSSKSQASSADRDADFTFANFKHQDADLGAMINHVCHNVCLYIDKRTEEVLENQRDMEKRIRGDLVQLRKDVKGNIDKILTEQHSLTLQIQNLERFSVEEKELSVPRFAYVTKRGEQTLWMKLTRGIGEILVLRFLCEAAYETGGKDMIGGLHEVRHEAQEGIDVRKIREWARTLLPILAWTLKVTFVAAKIAGNAALPGFGILFGDNQELSKMLDRMIQMAPGVADLSKYLFDKLGAEFIQQSLLSSSEEAAGGKGESCSWVPGTETQLRGAAKQALHKVLNSMGEAEQTRQIGLKRVWLGRSSDSGGTKHIVWICNECYESYMSHSPPLAHDV